MKVSFIFPYPEQCIDYRSQSSLFADVLKRFLGGGRTNYTPPLSLLMLAAVTPTDVEVSLVDERIEQINYNDHADLVGITVVTRSAPRAYEIAWEYRRRGAKVVLGGIHPSALPQEALQHADAVVLGEGERIWPEVLDDFAAGTMKRVYRGRPEYDLDSLPLPRRELIRQPEMYATLKVLNATRGCPNTCSFCSAGVGLLKKYRKRSVSSIVDELVRVPGKVAIFADDNIGWDLEYAKGLMRELVPLGIRWTGSISANAAEDPEFVELAAKSGCYLLSIGFESLSPEVIASIRKGDTNDPVRYPSLIRRLHKSGIAVQGNFIVGFDEDCPSAFDDLVGFFHETNLEVPWVSTLIPYPGSRLYQQYKKEGRLLHTDWSHYDTGAGQCVYLPQHIKVGDLMDGFLQVLARTYSIRGIVGRLGGTRTSLSAGLLATLHINMQYRKSISLRGSRLNQYRNRYREIIGA